MKDKGQKKKRRRKKRRKRKRMRIRIRRRRRIKGRKWDHCSGSPSFRPSLIESHFIYALCKSIFAQSSCERRPSI